MRDFCILSLQWLTFPLGHILWMYLGWRIFRMRKRKRWYYLPWYERGENCLELRPYSDIFKISKWWREDLF